MKVAICISGYLRTFNKTYSNFKKYILDQNKNCDIFIHTWSDNENQSTTAIARAIDLYQPQQIVVEPSRKFDITPLMNQKNTDRRNASGVLGMYYKIHACNELKRYHEKNMGQKYDVVVRYRPDINIMSDVNLSSLNSFSIPKHGDYAGVNDQFAFGSSELMDKYCEVYPNYTNILLKIRKLDPELILKTHLDGSGIAAHRPYIKYVILRNDGFELNNEIMEKQLGFVR